MFTTEQEMQAFDEYQAMQEREFARQTRVAAQEMIKEGCRRGHWPMVAAGYQVLAQSTMERAYCSGLDAGNSQMRKAGREAWNIDDWNRAVEVQARIIRCLGYPFDEIARQMTEGS